MDQDEIDRLGRAIRQAATPPMASEPDEYLVGILARRQQDDPNRSSDAGKTVASEPEPVAWATVPRDDDKRPLADSSLPIEMIYAGLEVLEKVDEDNCNYVAGETTDWDNGMVVVAVYRAMIAAAPSPSAALLAAEQRGRDAERARRGIYIASKVAHADRWRLLRDKIGYPIISTWIDEAGVGESQDLSDLWDRCITEASSAEVLVLNCEPGEMLKGGWVELGAALASGVPVIAVGIDAFSVANHRGIRHMPSMKEVMTLLKPMANGESFAAAIRKGDAT